MCSQYKLSTTHAMPHSMVPVMYEEKNEIVTKLMKFSLLPSWAKEPRVKFATHNARLDSIETKATWKKPFLQQRCLVPMTHFIEPIYEGEHAGYMVAFHEKSNRVLMAAGVYDHWMNPQSGEIIDSFAIITDEPEPFVRKIGHDRQPVFLKPEGFELWLTGGKKDFASLKEILCVYRDHPDFAVERDRPMKPGWEKRVSGSSARAHRPKSHPQGSLF